ncbi:MAG: peptide deformylase [Pseudomonadota bacterium]
MAILDIVTIPDQRLREVATPIDGVDDTVRALADDMLETMYDAPGVGLAAPQIGILKRLVVLDVSKTESVKAPMILVNPELTWTSDTLSFYEEGCLSIPDYYEDVERPEQCRVRYVDENGKEQERDCDGLLATVVQHEIDHLDGKLFIDYISKLKRDRVVRKFTKMKKRQAA